MRKIFTLILFSGLFTLLANSQTLPPTVVSSSSGFSSASNGSLSFNVAEMTMVQTFSSANNFLTQGFQQPEDLFVSVPEIPVAVVGLVVYPNLTSGLFCLQFTVYGESNKIISIYNTLGQQLKAITVQQANGLNKFDFDISAYAPGMYVIEFKLRNAHETLAPVISKINLLK